MSRKKYFVLDTNILLHSPDCLTGFGDNTVVISSVVLNELDAHQKDKDEKGYNAKTSKRMLKKLLNGKKEAELPNGGCIKLLPLDYNKNEQVKSFLPLGWNINHGDNILLFHVKEMIEQEANRFNGRPVYLVTNDTTLELRALMLDIPVQDYRSQILTTEVASL